MNTQNQQNTLSIVKSDRYNKAGYDLVIKFVPRTEYNDDDAILTAQKVKVFH